MIKVNFSDESINESELKNAKFIDELNLKQWPFVQTATDAAYWERLSSFYQTHNLDQYNTLAIVGIGGSSLGVRALYETLGAGCSDKKIVFFDDIDPQSFESTWDKIDDLKKTVFAVISKSGFTDETLFQANLIHQKLKEATLDLAQQAVVLTSNLDSDLGLWATKSAVPSFEMPTAVSGRFSVLTAVGGLPALFLNQSLSDLHQGVSWALEQKELIKKMILQNLSGFKDGLWVQLYWVYARRWSNFGLWLQQLWCESLAKKNKVNGEAAHRVSTAFVCQGPRDQHSILQQIAEAHNDKQIWFFTDEQIQQDTLSLRQSLFPRQNCLEGMGLGQLSVIEAQATAEALKSVGVSSQQFIFSNGDFKTICGAFMLMELYVAAFGELLEINAFDQPGVENTKLQISKILGRKH